MKIKNIVISLTSFVCLSLVLAGATTAQQKGSKSDIRIKTISELIEDFTSDDWMGRVAPAESELESRQAESIPEVLKLLDLDKVTKLRNTADLIYPGADRFYGHGWVMDYDVDWIPARAGWLLEELTFQDFGFHEGVVNHDEILMTVIKGKSDSYIAELKEKLKNQDSKKQARTLAIEKAKDWWQTTKKPWKRFEAVEVGLKSNDRKLQYRIFQWLRNGHTKCDGLTLVTFDQLLLPIIKQLSNSSDESIRTEMQYLLESNSKEKWWYRYKLERDYPDKYTTMELK